MTLGTLAANHALANLIDAYSGSYDPARNQQCSNEWANALNHMNDAMLAFAKDAAALEDYINGQR